MSETIQIPPNLFTDWELSPDSNWDWKSFSGFYQNTQGWTDELSGTYFPPTFSWAAVIKGRRIKDGGYFYQSGHVSGKEEQPLELDAAKVMFHSMVKKLDEFSSCDCVVGTPCSLHGSIPPESLRAFGE